MALPRVGQFGALSQQAYASPLHPKQNGAPSALARQSVVLNGTTDYYTLPNAALGYPNTDWAEIFCVKLNNLKTGLTQHIFNNGNFGGGGSAGNVHLYLSGGVLNVRLQNTTAANTLTATSALTPSIASDSGWFYITVRRVGANVEIAACPKGGTATTLVSTAIAGLGAMTPNLAPATIGTRSDFSAGTFLTRNNVSWYARYNGTLTNTQLQALAAGQDLVSDLGLTPAAYLRFDSNAATITDAYGNTATAHGAPIPRGGPIFGNAPITIDKSVIGWYGRVFQRAPGGTTKAITVTGTYTGSPSGIMLRALDKSGAQVAVPVAATYPSKGIWQATITVPQGAELAFEAYHANNAATLARTQIPWGVGAVLLVTGESIADQQASGSDWTDAGFTPNTEQTSIFQMADVWQLSTAYTVNLKITDTDDSSLWLCLVAHTSPASGTFAASRAANPTYWLQITAAAFQVDTINNTVGSIMHTIERMRAALGIPVMALVGAKTGSQLASGAPYNWDNYSYPLLHGKLKSALANGGGDAEAMLWVQGANDANASAPPNATQYQTALQNLIAQIRSYLPLRNASTLPCFITITGSNTLNNSPVDAAWRVVRTATMAAIGGIANAFSGGQLYDLPHDAGNALHPSGAGFIRLGKRQAQAILHALLPGSFANGMIGGYASSAAISSGTSGANTIDVNFTLDAGTTLQGLIGSTGLTGFSVANGSGTAQTITAAVILSATVVRLTTSAAPAAGWTVDYVATQNPTNTNLLYTNGTVGGDTAGIPVKPFTAPFTL